MTHSAVTLPLSTMDDFRHIIIVSDIFSTEMVNLNVDVETQQWEVDWDNYYSGGILLSENWFNMFLIL